MLPDPKARLMATRPATFHRRRRGMALSTPRSRASRASRIMTGIARGMVRQVARTLTFMATPVRKWSGP